MMNYQRPNVFPLDDLFNILNQQKGFTYPQTQNEPQHNASTAFALAEDIKARRARIAAEQKELEEAERLYHEQLKKIRFVADDDKIEMLIPREKMLSLIDGLTRAINENKEAKTYKITINL